MNWHPWNYPSLRGDTTRSETVRWGKELFTQISLYRPLIALVDSNLLPVAKKNQKVDYLLRLISEEPIQAHLYGDSGPSPRAQLAWTRNERGEKVEAYRGWVDVRPTERDDLRLVAWFRDGKPFHRKIGIQSYSFQRIATSSPPSAQSQASAPDEEIRADSMAMLAAEAIGADIFVTERRLPLMLGDDPWVRATVLNPEAALPLVGLYLRGQGKCIVNRSTSLGELRPRPEQPGITRNEFFWRAAETLLPEYDRWRIACQISARATGDDALNEWQSALLHRVRQTLQARDRLLRRVSVRQDWDTADDVLNELDQMLVWIMGALDVCARVAHVALKMDSNKLRTAGWQKDGWNGSVEKSNRTLSELVSGKSDGKHVLDIVATLRNLVHGSPLGTGTVILVIGPDALHTFVPIPDSERAKIFGAMTALGGPETWGVRYPLATFERHDPKRKDVPHLHPGDFVERLMPYVIKLLNDLMREVPVHELPGVRESSADLMGKMPVTLAERRILWQLALGEL